MLSAQVVQAIAIAAAAVAVVAVLLVLVLSSRLRRLHRAFTQLTGGDDEATFAQAVSRQTREAKAVQAELARVREDLAGARADLSDALRHTAVVRYDAFGDMGGLLSFSTALLDDAGDGIVLTSINGRTETRTYAKGIAGGTSEHPLSPEEKEAVDHAIRSSASRG